MRKDINIKELIADYTDNQLSNQEILTKHKISGWFLYNVISKNNLPPRLKMSGITIKNINQNLVISLYNDGLDSTNIAKQLGCSVSIIRKCLNNNNLIMKSNIKLTTNILRDRLFNKGLELIGEFIDHKTLITVRC